MADDGRRSPGDHGPLGIVRGLRYVRGHSLLGGHLSLPCLREIRDECAFVSVCISL